MGENACLGTLKEAELLKSEKDPRFDPILFILCQRKHTNVFFGQYIVLPSSGHGKT